MAEGWRRIEERFGEAAELTPGKRARYLAELRAEDPDTAREVESLLEADAESDGFLDQRGIGPGQAPAPQARVGSYELVERIGEGGSGTVYRARRADDAYRHEVAIKFLRFGALDAELRRRFQSERQILADLDHPNLARLLDGGTTDSGLPYLVMEKIDGLPIDEYCNRHALGIEPRIELFRQVAGAVQYIHQNLVVHRDIKPANILIDELGCPKLVDFGIAKLLSAGSDGLEREATSAWIRLLTPNYASPEQIRGEPITTVSDVYSLGVLLFLLLTGSLPRQIGDRSLVEVERLIEQTLPPLASRQILESARNPALETLCRATDLGESELARRLEGDLDKIVAKALATEPGARYGSVRELSDDLERHLARRPVLARTPTFRYRASLFLRRNRLPAGVAALFAALLLAFVASTVIQRNRLEAQRDVAEAARRLAVEEQQNAEEVLDFVIHLFSSTNPLEGPGAEMTAREILASGREKVETELAGRPGVQAPILATISVAYRRIGLFTEAVEAAEQALSYFQRASGDTRADQLDAFHSLGDALRDKALWEEAAEAYRRSIELREALGQQDTSLMADTLKHLAHCRQSLGDLEGAEALLERTLVIYRAENGPQAASTLDSLRALAMVRFDQGKPEDAERLLRDAIAIQRQTDAASAPNLATHLNNLGRILFSQGNLAGAEECTREALAILTDTLGERHPVVALHRANLGAVLTLQEKYQEAIPPLRQALDIWQEFLDYDHPPAGAAWQRLGTALLRTGQIDQAEGALAEAASMAERLHGRGSAPHREALALRSEVAAASGRCSDAAALLRAAAPDRSADSESAPSEPWLVRAASAVEACDTAGLIRRQPSL